MVKRLILIIGLLLISLPVAGQELNADVNIQAERLEPAQQNKLRSLEKDLEDYLNSYEYTDNTYGTTIPVNYQIYVQQANESGSTTTYTAQLLVTNGADQRYFDKSWEFPYNPGQVLKHEIYSPLTGVIDYYAYLVIAGEVDTYAKLAGTSYYNDALEVINQAQNSGYAKGWRDRLEKLNDLQNHRDFRVMKYNFFDAYWDIQEKKMDQAKISFSDTINQLEKIFSKNRDDKYTKIFLAGQADKFAWVAAQLGDSMALHTLARLDPENEDTYNSYLE